MLVDSHVHAFWLPPLVKSHVSESKSHVISVLGTAVAPRQVEKSVSRATLARAVVRFGGGIAPSLEPDPGLE